LCQCDFGVGFVAGFEADLLAGMLIALGGD
jgi:hypothetical protein